MSKRTKGMLYVTLAAVCWSVAGVCCKWIPWNNLSLNGVRALLAAAMMALLRRSVKVRLTKGNILGALATAGTSILFITSSKLTTAANAIVLQYAMPVYVILFCWLFYKQRPGRTDIITCVCIFAGVVLCSWEGLTGGGGNTLGDILALLAGVCFSLVFFCSRMPGADAGSYTFLGVAMGIPFLGFCFTDPLMTMDPLHWLCAAVMAAGLAGGYHLASLGMKHTSPVSASLLSNLEPILNPIWVFLFLGEQPGSLTLVGAAVVLVSATVYSIIGKQQSA